MREARDGSDKLCEVDYGCLLALQGERQSWDLLLDMQLAW